MTCLYLTGHRDFGNRGCEAIVRGTTRLLREQFPAATILLPSTDPQRDQAAWPGAAAQGIRLTPRWVPPYGRYWVHLQRLPVPALKRAGWPFPVTRSVRRLLEPADAVLAIGGDNYSLDYRLPSLLMALDGYAMRLGKPVVLWGASVGPFEREPHFVPTIRRHLARMSLIVVRERLSRAYLEEKLGLTNVIQAADPAFVLEPEPVDKTPFWPAETGAGVLGLNVSPLLERYRQGNDLRDEVAAFVREAMRRHELSVLLVPHVIPFDGSEGNSDAAYLRGLLERLADHASRVALADPGLNAAQLKFVISQCRWFMGGRTHSTIAALSSGVPCVSIGYSVKASGINEEVYGHQAAVLDVARLDRTQLLDRLDWLVDGEESLRRQLASAAAGQARLARDGMAAVAARIRAR